MRAQISFSTIVALTIALMVLMLVGTFFSGGFKNLSGKFTSFGRESSGDSTETGKAVACNTACTRWISEGCKATGDAFDGVKAKCTGVTDAGTAGTKCGTCT